MTEAQQAALAEANAIVTPFGQISTESGLELGQYDFLVLKLTPDLDKNGLYIVVVELQVLAPAGITQPYKRTLYVGKRIDPLAKLPETRLNNGASRFLKKIAIANKLPANDQSIPAFCQALIGKSFGCAIVEGKPYIKEGKTVPGGNEFGRNVTPVGMVPARIFGQPASEAAPTNGGVEAGAVFGNE